MIVGVDAGAGVGVGVDVKFEGSTCPSAPSGEWAIGADLVERHENAQRSGKAPCVVPVYACAPGLDCLPDMVILAAPEATQAFFLRFVEMNEYLTKASSHLSESQRHQIAMLCLCHLGPWNTLISPGQLYVVLVDLYPDVLSLIVREFRSTFHDEHLALVAIMREETEKAIQKQKQAMA